MPIERDQHREEQQHVDEASRPIEVLELVGLVLRVVLELRGVVRNEQRLDRAASLRGRDALLELHEDLVVERVVDSCGRRPRSR